jgi:hypothetical protein
MSSLKVNKLWGIVEISLVGVVTANEVLDYAKNKKS